MNITNEQAMKSINEGIENLYKDLDKGLSDSMIAFLNFASNMPKYSARNIMLLRAQMPHVSKVATFAHWKKLGRNIISGPGSGLKIIRPVFKKVENEKGEEEDKMRGFSFLTVFDVSQTDGEPLPEFMPSIGNDDRGLYNILKECMTDAKISVTEKDHLLFGAYGLSYGMRVEIKKSDLISMFSTLSHEYAHEILHQGSENPNLSKGYKECQAEATAYIVMRHFGFETTFCADYIKHYGNSAKEVKENLEAITKASKRIVLEITEKIASKDNESTQQTEENFAIAG